jgi:dTDP-4-dehydrorhamnose reductase
MADPFGPPVMAVGRQVEEAPRYTNPRDGAEWIAQDLEPAGAVQALLEELKPSHVILAAAMSRAADCEKDPEAAHRINVEVPGEVATWCAAAGARLVFLSTDQVFGGQAAPKKGYAEDAEPSPVQVYGRTKWEGEQRVLKAHPNALVVRLPLLYGDSGGRGLGASDSLLQAVDEGEVPILFEDEFRTPLEVTNAAQVLVECLNSDLTGILHVASKQRVDRYALGLAILDAMGLSKEQCSELIQAGLQADLESGAPRAGDVSLDASRASKCLETALMGIRRGLETSMGI